MADVYALQGKGDTGKTETLIGLYHLLEKRYNLSYMQVLDFFKNLTKDKKVILYVWFYKVGDKLKVGCKEDKKSKLYKIGIESYGDRRKRLEQSLIDFEIVGCDIIFCACRTKGETVDCINSFTQNNNHFIPQVIDRNRATQKRTNKNTADNLRTNARLP